MNQAGFGPRVGLKHPKSPHCFAILFIRLFIR
jgi:hypothetical protein